MIIGLSGYAQSGKNATAELLVEKEGFRQIAFADGLRRCVEALDPIVDYIGISPLRYNEAMARYGYETAKAEFPEFRGVLQRMGTEVGRNLLGENVWVELTFATIRSEPEANWVITDCRFPNEFDAIKANGGRVLRVTRPGHEACNDHVSEHALDGHSFDGYIDNAGTLGSLLETVRLMLEIIRAEEASP